MSDDHAQTGIVDAATGQEMLLAPYGETIPGVSIVTMFRNPPVSASTDETCFQLPYTDPVGLWFSRVMTLVLVVLIVFILALAGVFG